jgi:hypothetical protein
MIAVGLQTTFFLAGVYVMVVQNSQSNKRLQDEVTGMKDELKKLAQVVITQAVQTKEIETLRDQLVMLQRNVEDLRRGNGFVRGRTGLDGEYP